MRELQKVAIALLISMLLLPAVMASAAGRATAFTLANGLQLVVIPDHRLPIVTHMVFYRAGSADDPPGQSGVAHFLEHLMFKGTARYPTGQFDQIVMRAGGTDNAYTSADKTYYFEQTLAEALPRLMDLGADRMAGLSFPAEEAINELKVVNEERRAYQNDPDSVLAETVGRSLYVTTPYAHPVLGDADEMQHLTLAQALDFHRLHYTPNNAIVIVAGDAEPEQVRTLAEATYGKLPAQPRPQRAIAGPPTSCADGAVEQRSSRLSRARVSLYYLTPGSTRMGARSAAALRLLADILQSEVTSPLWDGLVTQDRLANDLSVTHDLHIASGEFNVTLEAADGVSPERLERAARRIMLRLRGDGIGAEALAIAKRRWLNDYLLSFDDQLGLATRYGDELTTGRTLGDIETEPDLISAVSLADINAILAATVSNRCYLTAVLAPSGSAPETGPPAQHFSRLPQGVR